MREFIIQTLVTILAITLITPPLSAQSSLTRSERDSVCVALRRITLDLPAQRGSPRQNSLWSNMLSRIISFRFG